MDVQNIIKGQNRKYLYIFGGVIITAIVLWYLFKDSVNTVLQGPAKDPNASDYDPVAEKSAINAEYAAKIAAAEAAGDQKQIAELELEKEERLEDVDRRADLMDDYYEAIKAYPPDTMTADMMEQRIQQKQTQDYNLAVSKYKARTNSNPPSNLKTAEQVNAALESWIAADNVAKQNAKDAEEWNNVKPALDQKAQALIRNTMFNFARLNTNSGSVHGVVVSALNEKSKPRNFLYLTQQFMANGTPENNNLAGFHPANPIQKLYCIANDKIGGTLANTDVMAEVRELYNAMDAAYKLGYTVDGNGKVRDSKGNIVTDYKDLVFFSGRRR